MVQHGRGTFAAIAVLAALLITAVAAPARAQSVDDIIKRGTLRVLIDTTNPPYGTVDDKMEPSGYEVDIAGRMAKGLGVKLEIVPVTSANRIPFLLTEKADLLLSTLTVTAERARQIWFTEPYAAAEFQVIAAKSRAIAKLDDLNGLKIGIIRGGATDTALMAVATPRMQILRFDDLSATMQALIAGQVDAIVENWLVPQALTKLAQGETYEGKITLQRVYFSMGVRRGSADLLQWVNTFLFVSRSSGLLSKLHEQYLGVALPPLPAF